MYRRRKQYAPDPERYDTSDRAIPCSSKVEDILSEDETKRYEECEEEKICPRKSKFPSRESNSREVLHSLFETREEHIASHTDEEGDIRHISSDISLESIGGDEKESKDQSMQECHSPEKSSDIWWAEWSEEIDESTQDDKYNANCEKSRKHISAQVSLEEEYESDCHSPSDESWEKPCTVPHMVREKRRPIPPEKYRKWRES